MCDFRSNGSRGAKETHPRSRTLGHTQGTATEGTTAA